MLGVVWVPCFVRVLCVFNYIQVPSSASWHSCLPLTPPSLPRLPPRWLLLHPDEMCGALARSAWEIAHSWAVATVQS